MRKSLALGFLLLIATCASADDWPQWLGIKRDGVSFQWSRTRDHVARDLASAQDRTPSRVLAVVSDLAACIENSCTKY